jgi:hypothetical protein
MWNMIIGAVSQATDPAKKLADDYCTYVISQGGTVDYATVYNIYKNEYIQHPYYSDMIDWWDARGGLIFSSGLVTAIYSLIFPYRRIDAATGGGNLLNAEEIEYETYRYFIADFAHMNEYYLDKGIRVEIKHRNKDSSIWSTNQYPIIIYSNSGASVAWRYGISTLRKRSQMYIYKDEGVSQTVIAAFESNQNDMEDGDYLYTESEINWETKIANNKAYRNNILINSTDADLTGTPLFFNNTGSGSARTRMSFNTYYNFMFYRHYKL